jgi:hypothetical protein
MRCLIREILELAPHELPIRAVEALPHHCGLVAWMLVANVSSEVVTRRYNPPVRRAHVLVWR